MQVTDDAKPPPGFVFVPIGDPILTNKCKELSREREAMIFIVSVSRPIKPDRYLLTVPRPGKKRIQKYLNMFIAQDTTFEKP